VRSFIEFDASVGGTGKADTARDFIVARLEGLDAFVSDFSRVLLEARYCVCCCRKYDEESEESETHGCWNSSGVHDVVSTLCLPSTSYGSLKNHIHHDAE
jgi:hypothetical protein